MTNDELVIRAVEKLRMLEERRKNVPEKLRTVTVDQLPKRRVRDAVVIDFEREQGGGRIQILMDRESGDMISATYNPPKDACDDTTI